jgi:hypothetical protein
MKIIHNILFGIVAVLSMPVVLPAMLVRNMIDRRHQSQLSKQVACRRCGKLLGEAAIWESNRIIAEEWKQLQAERPRVKLRKIRGHHAVCTGCGLRYFYSNQGRTYLPVAEK